MSGRSAGAPRLTVGLPVRNGENFLEEALESVRHQTFADFEVLVADNASTDGTAEICAAYEAHDERIRCIRNERDLGATRNHNLVLAQAAGEYFKWMAHDDVCRPTFFEHCVRALDACPDAVGAYPRAVDIDAEGAVLGKWPSRRALAGPDPRTRLTAVLRTNREPLPIFGVLRTEAARALGGLGAYPSSDRVFVCALALRGRLLEVPAFLLLHREHPRRSVHVHGWREHSLAWWDPARAGSLTFPHWRVLGELRRALRRAPLEPRQRRHCNRVLARWLADDLNWAKLVYDLAVPARPLLARLWARLPHDRSAPRVEPLDAPEPAAPRLDATGVQPVGARRRARGRS